MITQISNRLHRLGTKRVGIFCNKNKKGFILLFTLVLMVTLLAIVAGYLYLVSVQTRVGGLQLDDTKAFDLAEAGLERGIREIRDDVLSTTQIGTADLRGQDTSLSISIGTPANMRYIDTATATINANSDQAILMMFDSNYTHTRIKNIELHARASRGSGTTNPIMEVSYTTDGTNYTTAITAMLASSTLTDFSANITGTLTWSTIMSSNFRLRTMRTAGNRTINLDSMYLRVTYEIDTNTETWFQGFSNIPLGDGEIVSVNIIDESSKVNINYAADYSSNLFLSWLFRECGISSARAGNIATAVINYRNGLDRRPGRSGIDDDNDGIIDETDELGWPGSDDSPFGSIEEIKNIPVLPLLTEAEFTQIRDFITVYSYVNGYATRPPAWSASYTNRSAGRAPVNINSASTVVLQAMFNQILGEATAETLATQIIDQRTTVAPFTCFYNSDLLINTDFYDFIMGSSLTSLQKDRILDNADSSWLLPRSGMTAYDCRSTEFSYATNSFTIEALGQKGNSTSRLRMIIKDSGNKYLDTYIGDTVLTKYWRQIQ